MVKLIGKEPVQVLVITNPQLDEDDRWERALQPHVEGIAIVHDTQAAREVLEGNHGVQLLIINAFASVPLPSYEGRQTPDETIRFLSEESGLPDHIRVIQDKFEPGLWATIRLRVAARVFTILSKESFFRDPASQIPATLIEETKVRRGEEQ